ncbi:Cadherin-like, partial [Trinorchestia longiramus]
AEEQTPRRGFTTAPLTITVITPDSSVPRLRASAFSGTVLENSAPGTPVLDESGAPVTLSVSDPDLLPGEQAPPYQFELTTGAFKVTPVGELVVAVPQLDRDSPNTPTHTFQVVAREVVEGDKRGAASDPLSLEVTLGDVNDNPPRFPLLPPVLIPAGSKPLAITTGIPSKTFALQEEATAETFTAPPLHPSISQDDISLCQPLISLHNKLCQASNVLGEMN